MRTSFAVLMTLAFSCGDTSVQTSDPGNHSEVTVNALNGDNEAGENLGAVNLAGLNLGANNLAGVNLGGTNLAATNLAGTNLAATNLAGTNLGGNNLAGTNLAATNLAAANLAGTNLGANNLAGTNLASVGLGSTLTGAYSGRGCPVTGTYRLTAAAFTTGNAGVTIHAATAGVATGLLASGEDTFDRTKACIVAGLGSTAFSRLVSENAAGKTMYAAIRKLPWGLTDVAGGAKLVDSWEILVWGATSYTDFVVTAPFTTTFEGMQGFLKAVFRWNAPPAMTLIVGPLGSVATTLKSYTGMMDAAAKLNAGAISPQVHLAGLLGFASATTNNISVKVDFATWVMGTNGKPLILGNVGIVPTAPIAVESSFLTYDKGSGQVELVILDQAKGTTSTLQDYSDIKSAFASWKAGTRTAKPMCKRCAFCRGLSEDFGEAIPAGKCDNYVSIETRTIQYSCGYMEYSFGYVRDYVASTWSASLGAGAVKPFNDLMYLPSSQAAATVTKNEAWDDYSTTLTSVYPVLAETYVALLETPYSECTWTETPAQFCARVTGTTTWCGSATGPDTCATTRTVACNTCIAPLASWLSSTGTSTVTATAGTGFSTVLSLSGGGAPRGGAAIAMTSSDPASLAAIANFTVPEAQTSIGAYHVVPASVNTRRTVTLTATYAGVSKSLTVNLVPQPASLASLSGGLVSSPNGAFLQSGVPSSLTIKMTGSVESLRTVTLSSSNGAFVVPTQVTFAYGVSSVAVPITFPTTVDATATVTATFNGTSIAFPVTVVGAPYGEVELNDTMPTAGATISGRPLVGSVAGSDQDYFGFVVAPGKSFRVRYLTPSQAYIGVTTPGIGYGCSGDCVFSNTDATPKTFYVWAHGGAVESLQYGFIVNY